MGLQALIAEPTSTHAYFSRQADAVEQIGAQTRDWLPMEVQTLPIGHSWIRAPSKLQVLVQNPPDSEVLHDWPRSQSVLTVQGPPTPVGLLQARAITKGMKRKARFMKAACTTTCREEKSTWLAGAHRACYAAALCSHLSKGRKSIVVHSFLVLGLAGGFDPTQLLFFAGLAAIMYFVLIRPQQKQAKDQQNMIASLKKGDDVVTQGGILGKIALVAEKTITLEASSGVKLRILKTAIQAKVTVGDEPVKDEKKSDDGKKEEVK